MVVNYIIGAAAYQVCISAASSVWSIGSGVTSSAFDLVRVDARIVSKVTAKIPTITNKIATTKIVLFNTSFL